MAVNGTQSFDLDKFFKLKYGDSYISSNPFYYTQTNATPSVFLNAGNSNFTRTSNSAYPSVFNQTGSIPSVQNPITASYGVTSTDKAENNETTKAVAATNSNPAQAVVATESTAAANTATVAGADKASTNSTEAASSTAGTEATENPNAIYGANTLSAKNNAAFQRFLGEQDYLNFAVKNGTISYQDKVQYIKEGNMTSEEKLQGYKNLVTELQQNEQAVKEYLNANYAKETLENGQTVLNEQGQAILDKAMADGVISTAEKEAILNGEEAEEEEPYEPLQQPEASEESKAGREEEVIAAYNTVMDAMESGQDLKELANKCGNGDIKRIVADIEDDGIVGNGAAAAQFESNVIQNAIQKRSQKACDNNQTATIGGKTVDYNGSYDQNDNKTTSSRKNKSASSTSSSSSSTQTDKDKKPKEST